jgi:polyisoprenoid-binding protein YceI
MKILTGGKTLISLGGLGLFLLLTHEPLGLALSSSSSRALPEKYRLDNSHAALIFAVSHFGLSYTYGRFNTVRGDFSISDGQPTAEGFSFTIDSASLDTNHAERDTHLRGREFFDCEQFPEITFVTTGFRKVGDEYYVTGDLRLLDQIRSVTMPMKLVGVGTDMFGNDRAGFFTKFSIKRSDFGMDSMMGSIGDTIAITFSFEGIKEK